MNLWIDKNWTPMLLNEVDKPFNSKNYIYEIKYDGIRTLLYVNENEVKIYSRKRIDITHLYPELQNIKNLVKRNTIFDGELIIMENGRPSFSKLQNRAHIKNKSKIKFQSENNPVIFICFDLLYDNKNLIDLPLIERKKILDKYKENDYFIKSKYIENNGIDLYKKIKNLNLEGIVAKNKTSIYEINKRTDSWLKIKNLNEEEFYIGGYIENKENYVISILLGEYKDNKFYYIGKATLGKKRNLYKQIKKEKILTKSPFENYKEDNVNFIKPILTCKVKYLERTKTNHLRQPIIK